MTDKQYKAPEINKDYPNIGTMFARQKVEGKQPTASGFIYLDGDVLDYIIDRSKEGKDVVLDIAGWSKISKAGNRYQQLKIATPRNTEGSGDVSDDVPF